MKIKNDLEWNQHKNPSAAERNNPFWTQYKASFYDGVMKLGNRFMVVLNWVWLSWIKMLDEAGWEPWLFGAHSRLVTHT